MSDPSASSQPRLFHCPTCGASLPLPKTASVRCEYCGSNVLVPPEYLAKEPARRPEPSVVQIPTYSATISTVHVPAGQVRRGGAGVMILLVVICLVGVGVVAAGGVFTTGWMNTSIKQVFNDVATSAGDFPLTTLVPDLPLVQSSNIELQFGGGGSGAGQFDDPRGIAVDADGNIFVADYGSGRVQKFDPTGKFLQLTNVPPDRNDNNYILAMATNYAGQLYVVRGGDILVYETRDGSQSGLISGNFPDTYYDGLAIDPSNALYALHIMAHEQDLIKLSPEGEIIWRQKKFVEPLKNKTASLSMTLAVDGLGNIFVLDQMNYQVYKFDTQGEFTDRFGSKGSEPGQFTSPQAIAVNGQGEVFIDDFSGILVFDSNGTYLRTIPWSYTLGSPMGMTFDLQGYLYAATNQPQVVKMKVRP